MAFLCSPLIVRACTIVLLEPVEVGNEFGVRVMDQGQPVKGLRMVLKNYGSNRLQEVIVSESSTDAEGIARFSISTSGSFFLSPDHDAGIGASIVVYVSENRPKNTIVPLGWPSPLPLTVRSAEGTLRKRNFYPTRTQAEMSLALLEGISGKEIEKIKTDLRGRFQFSGHVTPGLYFIRIDSSGATPGSGEDETGTIAIHVDPAGKDNSLDLDVGWSDCGLVYAKRVAQATLVLGKVCGTVTDSEGGIISGAQVWLQPLNGQTESFNQTSTQSSDQILTSATGDFSFQERNAETYELIVQSRGFRTYVRKIQLQPDGASGGCPQAVHLVMDPL